MLTSKQRSMLRGFANKEEVVVILGKEGLSKEVLQSMEDAIRKRELIKVKMLETAGMELHQAAQDAADALHADCVQMIGSIFVLFRKKDKESKYPMI